MEAQVKETPPPEYIKSIELKTNKEYIEIPIIKLGQGFSLEFDDLVGDEADYYYKIKYFDFDWTPTDLSRNEYLTGQDNQRITDYKNSFNSLQIYTHYRLSFPNKDLQGFKISGNYMLEVYSDDDKLVFSKAFILYENIANIPTEIKRSRDLNLINSNQVVQFSITTDNQISLQNPEQNLKVRIIQNNDFKNSISGLKPQYYSGSKLLYRYDKETSFPGGNEFLYFDTKDLRASTVRVKNVELNDIYSHHLHTDHSRFEEVYTYNPDINGSFKINSAHAQDNSTESEYTWVYFTLDHPEVLKSEEVHIYGGFNDYFLNESTLMSYNQETDLYEGRILLKQGFYNYKYVIKDKNGDLDEGYISGNFDKTENQYRVLAYYRAPGARYDRLIGLGKANSEQITD